MGKFSIYYKIHFTFPPCLKVPSRGNTVSCSRWQVGNDPHSNSTESVPRREEGSTGKYQHDVETECWYFPVLPDLSQGTDIIKFIKVMKL